jgi:hypothetical protein
MVPLHQTAGGVAFGLAKRPLEAGAIRNATDLSINSIRNLGEGNGHSDILIAAERTEGGATEDVIRLAGGLQLSELVVRC